MGEREQIFSHIVLQSKKSRVVMFRLASLWKHIHPWEQHPSISLAINSRKTNTSYHLPVGSNYGPLASPSPKLVLTQLGHRREPFLRMVNGTLMAPRPLSRMLVRI